MNIQDMILIILCIVIVFLGVGLCIYCMKEKQTGDAIFFLLLGLIVSGIVSCTSFVVIDASKGSTMGIITSVDKNLMGTTNIYVKTTETDQEKYCAENEEIVSQAKKLIGKKVKVSYGERFGLYSTGSCQNAPIDKIEEIE